MNIVNLSVYFSTCMGNNADLTVIQKIITNAPSTRRVDLMRSLEKGLAFHRELYRSIFMEGSLKGKSVVGEEAQAIGMTTAVVKIVKKS